MVAGQRRSLTPPGVLWDNGTVAAKALKTKEGLNVTLPEVISVHSPAAFEMLRSKS